MNEEVNNIEQEVLQAQEEVSVEQTDKTNQDLPVEQKTAEEALISQEEGEEKHIEKKSSKSSRARSLSLKIAVTSVFTALSYGLYLLGRFCKLPFMFPSFFDLQFSELPALIVGFALGPAYGGAVVVIKCLLKMPLSQTGCVGEATDILLGLLFVLPATILYRCRRNLKGAIWGSVLGSVTMVAGAILVNRFISVPFYLNLYFKGDLAKLAGALSGLFPKINANNFYFYYLVGSVIPFNLLRCVIMCVLTFVVYKRLSKLIHRITR